MALMLDEEMDENVTTIKVIGVGGGGGNAVNRMVSDGLQGVEFIAMNTDQQALAKNHAATKVQLGSKLTKGRSAGADPEIGQRAAEESKDEIANALKGSQMVFITAGMGGGTGTGAAHVVAEVAHDLGILTVGIVTKPFSFEGKRKMGLAEQGIANLLMHVDSLIVIPNERLKMISQEKITLMNAFQAADNVLRQGVESISALINVPAFINLDFADVRSIMKDAGYAHMGVGSAKGAGKAENAAKAAISSPLLETSIAGAHGVIINITSSPDIGLEDVETAAGLICCKRNFHFRQHIACVEAFIHLHNGYAAHFIAVHDSPLDRRCSAVSRKQGCMNVDASVFRHVQNLFWNNLAECNDNDHIRLHFPDLLDRLCIPHAARLIDRKAVFFGCLFHRCRHHLFSAALRFVRLGHNACDLITGLHECLKCSHGEIRGSHKYHFHLKSSPLF